MTVDRQAKAEAKRKQKGLTCAKALAKASASLNEYLQACNDRLFRAVRMSKESVMYCYHKSVFND